MRILLNSLSALILAAACAAASADTRLVSVREGGEITSREPNDGIRLATNAGSTLSDDARYFVFATRATNFTSDTSDRNRSNQVFRFDALNDTVEAVSITSDGVLGNEDSYNPTISADGNIIAFESTAENLINGNFPSEPTQILLRNMQTGELRVISQGTGGALGNGSSRNPAISADGNIVAFQSRASNLAANDTNNRTNIFIRNLTQNSTTLVSKTPSGSAGNGESSLPSIDATGNRISFQTQSTNFAPALANGMDQIHLVDLAANTIALISTSPAGQTADQASQNSRISGDGTQVAFQSSATNLLPNTSDTQIFLREAGSTTLRLVSRNTAGDSADSSSTLGSINFDGSRVSFTSSAANLSADKDDSGVESYIANTTTGEPLLLRTSEDGRYFTNQLNRSATHIAGFSVSNDQQAIPQGSLNIQRLADNTLTMVQANPHQQRSGNGLSQLNGRRNVSYDGDKIIFFSEASNLVADDSNGSGTDIFQYSEQADEVMRIDTAVGNGLAVTYGSSNDGTKLMFASGQSDLVAGDTNGTNDLFLLNTTSGDIQRVSTDSNNSEISLGSSVGDLSGDGNSLVFQSQANLAALPNPPAFVTFLYHKNLETGQVQLIDQGIDGNLPDSPAETPTINSTGRFVAFNSSATNLEGANSFESLVYLYDSVNDSLQLVPINSPSGEPADSSASVISISGDGRFIAFLSSARNLDPADTDNLNDLYLIDVSTGDVELISRNSAGEVANNDIPSGDLSDDGNAVVFITNATNMHPDAREDVFSVYVRDRSTGVTELVSATTDGIPGNNNSFDASISGDGLTVAFQSRADNLDADANNTDDVFRHRRTPDITASPLFSSVLPSSRTATVGIPFTVFATIIASTDLSGCRLRLGNAVSAAMSYTESSSVTNEIIGTRNQPVDLTAGLPRSFVVSITPNAVTPAQELPLQAFCASGPATAELTGVNTLAFSATNTPSADVIALAATPSADGVLGLPGDGDFAAFSVAAINLGADSDISVIPNVRGAALTEVVVCQTDPVSGACMSSPMGSVTLSIAADQTPTFSVFARSSTDVPFDPGANRIELQFLDDAQEVRGRTSVAVQR